LTNTLGSGIHSSNTPSIPENLALYLTSNVIIRPFVYSILSPFPPIPWSEEGASNRILVLHEHLRSDSLLDVTNGLRWALNSGARWFESGALPLCHG